MNWIVSWSFFSQGCHCFGSRCERTAAFWLSIQPQAFYSSEGIIPGDSLLARMLVLSVYPPVQVGDRVCGSLFIVKEIRSFLTNIFLVIVKFVFFKTVYIEITTFTRQIIFIAIVDGKVTIQIPKFAALIF